MELRGAEAPLFHVTAGVGDESSNKKRDPGGAAFVFSTISSLYHTAMGDWDIFA
jgi:hypothetical protein